MNARLSLTIAAVCAIALGGCASVTEGIDFQAPGSGWTATPSLFGRTQIWMKNADNKGHASVVILVRGLTSKTEVFNNPGFGSNKNMHFDKDEQTKICSGQPAEHVMASGKWTNRPGNEERAAFEAFLTTVKGEKFLAMYMHPADQPPDPSAEAAIRSLCPKAA